MGIDLNGVNGSTPILGTGSTSKAAKSSSAEFNFGFEAGAVGDKTEFSGATKPAFTQFDMDQMWNMVGLTNEFEGMEGMSNADMMLDSRIRSLMKRL